MTICSLRRSFPVIFWIAMVGTGVMASAAHADVLYGFSSTSLVSFNTETPGTFATIGAHGIAPEVSIYSPTYDPGNGRVYAFGQRAIVGGSELSFLEFNLTTGAGSTVSILGLSTTQSYEALAYDPSLGSMVASQSNLNQNNPTPRLGTMSRLGSFALLSNTGLDNDLATFDATRGRFYTFDVQAFPNQAYLVNPATGGSSSVGGILQTLSGVAWSSIDDAIYGIRSDNSQFVRVASGTAFAPNDLGLLAAPLTGIFAIPSPSAAALLGLGGLMAARRRR